MNAHSICFGIINTIYAFILHVSWAQTVFLDTLTKILNSSSN